MIDINCTVVTALFNINRSEWKQYYRTWDKYLEYFSNTLSLKSKFVIYVEESTVDFVKTERIKVDPNMEYTKIIEMKFEDLPKYKLRDRIEKVMTSSDYKQGLVEPAAPEYNNPDYSVLILSKMGLVEDAITRNFYDTEKYMWLDAGIRQHLFKSEDRGKKFPNPSKIDDIKGIRILCRIPPKEKDLNIKEFYKSHQNRFGAGVIVGKSDDILKFNLKIDDIMEEALSNNLIDSEQSLHCICYLRNKEMFELIYNSDWYYHFDMYL